MGERITPQHAPTRTNRLITNGNSQWTPEEGVHFLYEKNLLSLLPRTASRRVS